MKINELRIGNWVQIDDLPPEQITLDVFATLKQVPATISKFNPISLTHEKFEKCGFVWQESLQHWVIMWGKNGTQFIKKEDVYKGFSFQLGRHSYKVIDHLHQLQNLYFAITGEELTYTP